jgi:hypothetical protein
MGTTQLVLVLALLALLTPPPAFAAAANAERTDYDRRGDVFSVPLTVADNSGVDRRAWPVTTGVPLPPGLVKDVGLLRLVDERGREVPAQFGVLNRYAARDGSLRWVLVDFQVDLPARGRALVRLTNDRPAAPVPDSLNLKVTDGEIVVETGPLKAVVGRHSPALLKQVTVGGKLIVDDGTDTAAPGLRTGEVGLMERHRGEGWNNAGWNRETTLDKHFVAEADYAGRPDDAVSVETVGPLRTVLVVRGGYRPAAAGRGIVDEPYRYATRLTFFRGHGFVQVEHDIENSSRKQPQWMHLFREATLNYRLRLNGRVTYMAGGWGEGGTHVASAAGSLVEGQQAWLVQARPENVERYGRSTAKEGGFAAGIGRRGEVEAPTVKGARGRFLGVDDGDKGVAVGMRYLWEQAPSALAVGRDSLAVHLHADSPGRVTPAGERRPEYALDFGERSSRDVLLHFFAGPSSKARVAEVMEAFEYPLFAYASPAWYADTGAWYFELSRAKAEAQKPKGAKAESAHWQPDLAGFRRHAREDSYNSGGHHDSQTSGWLPFIRSGDLQQLEQQLARSRWSIAHNPGWVYTGNRLVMGASADRYGGLDRQLAEWNRLTAFGPKDFNLWKSPETETVNWGGKTTTRQRGAWSYLNGYKVLPDIDHYALFRMFEYYNLTGDPRALDAIHGFVNWAVNFQHRMLFVGKTLGLEVTDHFERDPMALYRGHYSRIYAWMLFTTLAGYQTTGSAVFDEFARWQIRRALALLRDRHGQLTSVSRFQGDGEDHEVKDLLKASGAVLRSRSQSWMEAINVAALHEAYKTYDDERILDGIWGQADYFSHHVLAFPQLGMINNWTAMPNDPLIAGGDVRSARINPIGHDFQTLAWPLLYHYTGWNDVKDRYDASEAGRKGGNVTPYFLQTGAWQRETVPKRSASAPDPVRDLRVVGADRRGIALAWTSPKDDGPSGRAARYFVKISDKPIVEFAPTDDPARDAAKRRIVDQMQVLVLANRKNAWRPPPPPKEGEIQGETAGIRRESPDWLKVNAFWMAEHVAGEPVPGPSGSPETFTVTELRPHQWFGAPQQPGLEVLKSGTYHMALCSWDEDRNLSRLSNVVSFTLR